MIDYLPPYFFVRSEFNTLLKMEIQSNEGQYVIHTATSYVTSNNIPSENPLNFFSLYLHFFPLPPSPSNFIYFCYSLFSTDILPLHNSLCFNCYLTTFSESSSPFILFLISNHRYPELSTSIYTYSHCQQHNLQFIVLV